MIKCTSTSAAGFAADTPRRVALAAFTAPSRILLAVAPRSVRRWPHRPSPQHERQRTQPTNRSSTRVRSWEGGESGYDYEYGDADFPSTSGPGGGYEGKEQGRGGRRSHGGRGAGRRTGRAGRGGGYRSRPGEGSREWTQSGSGRGGRGGRGGRQGRGTFGRGGRTSRGSGRENSRQVRGRLDPETVAKGKALAAKIKELGFSRDWRAILAALEEGPKNAIVCTVAINALGKIGKWREAVQVLDGMERDKNGSDRPDAYVYASAINACGKAGKPVEAVALLSEMTSKGVRPDVVCFGAAITALSEVAGTQNRSGWGTEVKGSNGTRGAAGVQSMRAHEKAVALIQQMRRDGPSPNELCFASAITACARAADPRAALRLLATMREEGVAPNDVVLNAAVDACGKGGAPDEAVKLLRAMEGAYGVKPDNVSYNSAISALSRAGRAKDAKSLLDEMSARGLKPDKVSFSAAMQGFATAGDKRSAASLSEAMRSSGVGMDVVSYGTAVSACAKAGDVNGALKLIEEMEAAGLEANTVVYNAALDACGRAGKPREAAKIIEKMTQAGLGPNATSYTGAIAACSKAGDGARALEWLDVMTREGIAPEAICYNYAMAACGRSGNDRHAERLLRRMREEGVTPNRISYSAAMFALGKAGRLDDVIDLLREMHNEGVDADEVTYHIAVDAASIAGELGVAMDLFREMRGRGLPVTRRRVEYIRDKIAGKGNVHSDGEPAADSGLMKQTRTSSRGRDRVRVVKEPQGLGASVVARMQATTTSSRKKTKKSTRRAIHGGGGEAVGVDGTSKSSGVDDGKDDGADFFAELEERFSTPHSGEELASDDDLALYPEDKFGENPPPASASVSRSPSLWGPDSGNPAGRGSDASPALLPTNEENEAESMRDAAGRGDGLSTVTGEFELASTDGHIAHGGEAIVTEEVNRSKVQRQAADWSLEDMQKLKVTELKAELRNRGLRVSGTKADLLARLDAAVQQPVT